MNSDFSTFYRSWIRITSIALLIGGLTVTYLQIIWPVAALAAGAFTWFLKSIPRSLREMPWVYGYANWVTIFRLALMIVLLLLIDVLDKTQLFVGFFIAVLLDGLDGFIARRFDQKSEEGAMLDMESDAFLVFALSLVHVNNGDLPLWILLPGAMRYLYEVCFSWLPSSPLNFPPKLVRATIAVIFFFALLTPFVLDRELARLITGVAGALILLSFSSSLAARFLARKP